MSSGTKVVLVGAGIAGPVLACFLKLKGYNPVLYERSAGPADTGVGHCMQPSGLAVLHKVPGLVESIEGAFLKQLSFYSVLPEDPGVLANVQFPEESEVLGVRRIALQKALLETTTKLGVDIRWGHKLVDLHQDEEFVTVKFENGHSDTASLVVGCDGLHSNTRTCLFGAEKADFTGLIQIGGVSPLSAEMKTSPKMLQVFGNGSHLVCYNVNDTQCTWAVTRKEPEQRESWRDVDQQVAEAIKTSEFAQWGYGVGEIVKGATRLVKYGLYDRPELKTWHKGRVLLIGDAAHPTSPHLGQGANQAFEDIDLLITLLEKHSLSASPPSIALLESLFSEFEAVRIPRSSAMVKGARAQGETRVAEGVEACLKRNAHYRETWKDEESIRKHAAATYGASR